jgi:HK97 family phage major capsid protein
VFETTNYSELRARKVAEMGDIIAKAESESRNLNAEEASRFDQLEREARQLEHAAKTVERYGSQPSAAYRVPNEARDKAFDRYMRHGERSAELRTTYDAGMNESGFQASGTAGGFMVPQGFWEQLTIAQKAYNGFSEYYRQVETPTGNPMDWPTVDPTGILGHIIAEGTIDTFQDYTIGQGVLNAWTYTNPVVLASLELVNDSAFDIGSFVAARIGEAIGRAEGAHSASGTGSGQPLGVYPTITAKGGSGGFFALTAGTTTNVVGGTTVTELAGNVLGPVSLSKLVQSIDSAYWPNAAWYFSPAGLVAQRNLADGMGRPLYPTLFDAQPSLLGFPVRTVAQVTPLTASTVSGPVFGDLEAAMVRRRVDHATLMVLHERYADARQVGYYGFERLDHRSNDVRALVCAKPAGT